MKIALVIIGLIYSSFCLGQDESSKLKIYSDFINAEIREYDSIFENTTEIVFLSSVEKFDSSIDLQYLKDYLSGNIENNNFYKEYFDHEPTQYFDLPPTFGLGKTIKEDAELGELLVDLIEYKKFNQVDLDMINNVAYGTKIIKKPKRYFKMGREKFRKKFDNAYGIMMFSDIIFNESKDRAIFYVEQYRGSLDATGDIIVMQKKSDKWTIETHINQWMS
ncbi:MAG: hypothetical protein AAF992_24655 [Bacteroidota bacterium]